MLSGKEIMTKVSPNINESYLNHKWLTERQILVEKIITVNSIKFELLKILPQRVSHF